MIISRIETFTLRIPFKPNSVSADAAWGDGKDLPAADSLLAFSAILTVTRRREDITI